VYDMYPWDGSGPGGRPPGTPRARGDSPSPRTPLTRAVQVALDRRDNGGDTAAAADATDASGQPTAGPTRQ
jgi:hypothetical protein